MTAGSLAGRDWRRRLAEGLVIPAHPLALDKNRSLDEKRQRALSRYYLAAGAGGLAVGVHTTQFAIRDAGMYRPVLELAAETARQHGKRTVLVAGVAGSTRQAVAEAMVARDIGYHLVLVSPAGWGRAPAAHLVAHMEEIGRVLPVMGFYLQPAVGGIRLPSRFWSQLLELPQLVAIKVAPFDRYQTTAVARAVAASGRRDVALYTGNDDHILLDLVTPFPARGRRAPLRFAGGLLGHWAIGTKAAVTHHRLAQRLARGRLALPASYLELAQRVTELNAAVFDARHGFRGCIPGIHEVLRRQGLLAGRWCLDPAERLSTGQAAEITEALAALPLAEDDELIRENLDEWLR